MGNFNLTLYNTFLGRGIHVYVKERATYVHTFPRRDIKEYNKPS